jgi:hypothetical protein
MIPGKAKCGIIIHNKKKLQPKHELKISTAIHARKNNLFSFNNRIKGSFPYTKISVLQQTNCFSMTAVFIIGVIRLGERPGPLRLKII